MQGLVPGSSSGAKVRAMLQWKPCKGADFGPTSSSTPSSSSAAWLGELFSRELFDEMLERNVVSWTTMISGYSNSKLNHKALESLVLEAKFDAFRPKFERPFCCFCIEMVELENAQKPL
ncbi:hypothetical protein PS1_039940 [Malus domestica]